MAFTSIIQEQLGALMAKCNETAYLMYSMTMMNMNYYDGSSGNPEKYLLYSITMQDS